MDRKSLLAVALCFLIFLGWQKLYIEPRLPHGPAQTQAVAPPVSGQPSTPGTLTQPTQSATTVAPTQHAPETRTIPNEMSEAVVGDGNRVFVGWKLKGYRLGLSPQAAAIDLASVTNQDGEVELAFDDPAYGYLSKVQGTLQNTPTGVAWIYEDANIKLRRDIVQVPGEPFLSMTVSADFKAHRPNYLFLSVASESPEKDPEAQDRQLLYWSDKSLERVRVSKEVKLQDVVTPVKYIARIQPLFPADAGEPGISRAQGPSAAARNGLGPNEHGLSRDRQLDHAASARLFRTQGTGSPAQGGSGAWIIPLIWAGSSSSPTRCSSCLSSSIPSSTTTVWRSSCLPSSSSL